MFHINNSRFDSIIIELIQDCPDLTTCNCDNCTEPCILYQELRDQNIDEVPDILNTLRLLFIDEFVARDKAIKAAPRFSELTPKEYYKIVKNSNHFRRTEDNTLIAIY